LRLGPADAGFPGPKQLSDHARSHCEGRVREYLGTEDAFSYGFEVPRRESWKQGTRHGMCWAETSD
jgi:Septum formation